MQTMSETELREQKRVAKKYRTLGYEVLEHPQPHLLPDFLRNVTPDIVARSDTDNVIIEVKQNAPRASSSTT